MGNIVLLDDLTINKIAAGEVIERPASVIKEMIENSIDAGAKNITVEIKNGGISLIKITDDGCGIAEDDMEIAFERHATSKIRTADDLERVTSMGFRGEALASIAAIANVEMVSKKDGTDEAHKIVVEGGKILEKTVAARSVGTTITVQKLFFNTPVRYKFLKKDYTEAGYIEDAVTRIALINKGVAIKLINNGKTVIQTNGNGDFKTVIYNIYGKDIASEIIEIDYEYEDMKVSGVIGKPVIARANRINQLFFVNGRYVRDKNLSAAAEQAYKGMIPVGRYGFIVLNIEMNPKMVDVNVHPAKLEVRFEDDNKVFKAVYHAIKSGFANSELVAVFNKDEKLKEETINNIDSTVEAQSSDVDERKNFFASLKNKHAVSIFQRNEENSNEEKIIDNSLEDEQEETNTIEEVYKFRNELKKIGVNPEATYQINNYIKDEVLNNNKFSPSFGSKVNETKFADSDNENGTKEMDSNKVNEYLKSITQEIQYNKSITNDTEKNGETTVFSTLHNYQEENLGGKTNQIESLHDVKANDVEKEEINSESFEKNAGDLLNSKIGVNNTESLDTSKVREAIKENFDENQNEFNQMYKKTFGTDTFSVRREKEIINEQNNKMNAFNSFTVADDNINVFNENEIPEIKYKFIGIAFNTYIIIEIKDELYIIDQHAAHERIMYEKVKENYYSEDTKDMQYLLLPDVITLTHKDMLVARENVRLFEKAGFVFEEFGENTVKLVAVPSMCEDMNTKQLFIDILDEIDTVAITAKQEKEDKFIATVACKAAVKGKMKLDEKEVHSLMKKLLELPNPFTCPHGRPTAIKMTKYDMERKFNRK